MFTYDAAQPDRVKKYRRLLGTTLILLYNTTEIEKSCLGLLPRIKLMSNITEGAIDSQLGGSNLQGHQFFGIQCTVLCVFLAFSKKLLTALFRADRGTMHTTPKHPEPPPAGKGAQSGPPLNLRREPREKHAGGGLGEDFRSAPPKCHGLAWCPSARLLRGLGHRHPPTSAVTARELRRWIY